MARDVPFQTVIDALLDESVPFPARYRRRFSDLAPIDLSALNKAWPQVSSKRKQALLRDLEKLAEDDSLVSFENLARALLKDPDAQVRVLAIRLLRECEDAKLAPVLLDILDADSDAEVRAAAATALGLFVYLGELELIPEQTHHKVEDHLLEATRPSEPVIVRRRALEALGASSRPEVPPLIEAAYRAGNTDWMTSALFAMGRSADPQWEKYILSKLHNPDGLVRAEAMQAAVELGLQSARPALLDLLADEEDIDLRREIVWSLSKIGGEGIRNRLEELLETEMDEEEVDFLEEALDNLAFTEDMASFDLLGFEVDGEEPKES